MKNLIQNIKYTLGELQSVIQLMNDEQFSKPLTIFSGSSIGMHARHIVEFYLCLLNQHSNNQTINYDKRERDNKLQSCTQHFGLIINGIVTKLDKVNEHHLNTPLSIMSDGEDILSTPIVSSLARELQYNLEHTIHHSAFIKIGVLTLLPDVFLPKTFGVAPSTLRHQKQK
jgi:hypothetical protein